MRKIVLSLLAMLFASGTALAQQSNTSSQPTVTGQVVANGALVGIQRFATHGTFTYTPDAGTNTVLIKLLGAGASGNGCSTPAGGSANIGQTGGGGAYLEKLLTTNFSGKQIVVGQGGAASSIGDSPGNSGGDTTFDAAGGNYRAGGGVAGTGMNSAAYGWQVLGQAAAGTAINGDLNEAGQIGGPNTSFAGLPTASSVGANSRYGQGGIAEVIGGTISLPGAAGIGNGSGSSGGLCLSSGPDEPSAAGTDGYAEIDEYH